MNATKKQLENIKVELISEISDLYLTLGYSYGILEDYKSDLQEEVKYTSKEIAKSKRKLKSLKLNMDKLNIRVPAIRKP